MTTAKKTNWLVITLVVLVACAVVGLILAAVQFNSNPGRTCASATLQFSFNGAGEGKAPDGYPFDVNGMLTEEVLANGLEASGLTGTYTTDQIRENLTITSVYPENIVKQMTTYTSLLDANADMQAALVDYHATLYSVALYNDFDPGIASSQLTGLLSNILEAYRVYFRNTCAANLRKTDPITDLQEYDYTQQLQAISEAADQQSRFAQEMADRAPDFRRNRKGFDDIVVSYSNLKTDIDRLDAAVTLNSVSKDRERLRKQYEMELRTLNRDLEGLQEELGRVEELVASYEKDGIVYVSTSSSLQRVAGNASATYDKLVMKRKELTESITSTNADIAKYEALLADITGNTASKTTEAATAEADDGETLSTSVELTEEELRQMAASTEKQIETLSAKKNRVTADFTAMLSAYAEQEVNESTVSVTGLRYKAPSVFSGVFLIRFIKTAGPFCVIGFMVCLVLLIIKRRKEEKYSHH